MSIHSCPGTIQLANALSAGIGVESVAYAKMGQAMNAIGNQMNTFAQDEYKKGLQAIALEKALEGVQWATIAVGILTLGIGTALSTIAGAATSTAMVSAISSGVNGAAQVTQATLAATQSVMQAAKGQVQASTEVDSIALHTFEKTSQNDADTAKNESQGAGKIGSAITTMLLNEGAVERQRII
jgi:hypothetical protein